MVASRMSLFLGWLLLAWGILVYKPLYQLSNTNRPLVAALVILLAGWGLIRLDRKINKRKFKNRFHVSLVNSILGGPYHAYKSENDNLYFIDVLFCINLVNETSVLSKVSSYYGTMKIDREWATLQCVPYFEKGQFYLVAKDIGRSRAIEFNQKTIDEQIGYSNIKPGETISGILMFYFKDTDKAKYFPNKKMILRLIIYDSMNNKEEHRLILGGKRKANKDASSPSWLGAFGFKVIGQEVDLRKFKIGNSPPSLL
jgi:hypothetical protein